MTSTGKGNRSPRMLEGKPIRDALEPVSLAIRTSDCKHGLSKAPDACAAAIACVRQLEALGARVHMARTFVEYDDHWLRFRTSPELTREIRNFDAAGMFKPGIYLLAPLQPSKRTGKKRQGSKNGENKNTKRRPKHHRLKATREHPHFSAEAPAPAMAALGPIRK